MVWLDEKEVIHSFTDMIKKLSRIGNSRGIIFDTALLEETHLKEGDEVNVTVHEGFIYYTGYLKFLVRLRPERASP